jgi:hypothetical protein
LKSKSFNLRRAIGGRSELSFVFNIPIENIDSVDTFRWKPQKSQFVRVYMNDAVIFYGTITKVNHKLTSDKYQGAVLFCNVSCNGLNSLANRRHIKINYPEGTNVGNIVSFIITNILRQDGIKAGMINNGIDLADDWVDDCISTYELLDACAEKSGFQWFVDDYGFLQFYQDPITIPECTKSIVQGAEFKDFYNLDVTDTCENFITRVFVVGGFDEEGNQIQINSMSEDAENARQIVEGGSGVYGYAHHDSGLVESDYRTAESGTTSSIIALTNHGMNVGDMVWNHTRRSYSNVTVVGNANQVSIYPPILNQVSNDRICLFNEANGVIRNILKRDNEPTTLIAFDTQSILDFSPGQKLTVNLPCFGIYEESYLIEKVTIQDMDGKNFAARVEASKRNTDNFSTQRSPDYTDYWKNF